MSKEEQETGLIEAEIVKDNDGQKARKKVEKKRKFYEIVAPILVDVVLLILGICLLIWADKVTNFISISIGIVFILYGVYNFLEYMRASKDEKRASSIITGIALTLCGLFLCIQTSFIKESISFIIGVFIILISLIRLQDSLKFRSLGPDFRLPTILSIVGIFAGVLCIVGKIMIPDIFIQILGVMLIIFSTSNIVNNISLNRLRKK